MRKLCLSVTALFILISFACSNEGFFPLENADQSVALVEVLSPSSVFSSGEIISLSIVNQGDSQITQELIIHLYSDTDKLISEFAIENLQEWDYMPEIEIPDLDDGFYYFLFSLYEADSTLAETRKEFFVYRDSPTVVNLSSYPPVIYPDSSGLIFASIEAGDSDPYIAWTQGGQIYKEGYLSSGLDQLQWQSPEQDGVYRIALELYPYKPPAGFSGIMNGAGYSEIQLFVDKNQTPDVNEFSFDASRFLSLLHFRGEYKDFADSSREVQVTGQPILAFEGKSFGYKLNGNNGFYMNYPVIPFISSGILDFTFMLKGILYFPQTDGNLFSCESGDSSFYISFSDEGQLSALLTLGNSTVSSLLPPDTIESSLNNLALSVFQDGRKIGFRWFADGKQIWESEAEALTNISVEALEGWSLIAGENGIIGLVDEFGIYYRDSEGQNAVCGDIYREMYARSIYGDSLVFADGFDGIDPGVNYQDGFSGSLYQGKLSLAGTQTAKTGNLSIADEISRLSLSWEQSRESLINITVFSSSSSAEIGLDFINNNYILNGRVIPFDRDYPEYLTFSLNTGILSLYSSGAKYSIMEFDQQSFSVMLENGADEAVMIDNIIITKESKAIIKDTQETDSLTI